MSQPRLPKHFHTSKNIRLFYLPLEPLALRISVSKKNFKLAVDRNKIKRRIKEIFREKSLLDSVDGVIVFSVFRPFGELSYSDALKKVDEVVCLYIDGKKL